LAAGLRWPDLGTCALGRFCAFALPFDRCALGFCVFALDTFARDFAGPVREPSVRVVLGLDAVDARFPAPRAARAGLSEDLFVRLATIELRSSQFWFRPAGARR
jgi:hypothetical protein